MQNHLGLIEMLAVFGIVIVVVVWELASLREPGKKRDEAAPRDPPGNDRP